MNSWPSSRSALSAPWKPRARSPVSSMRSIVFFLDLGQHGRAVVDPQPPHALFPYEHVGRHHTAAREETALGLVIGGEDVLLTRQHGGVPRDHHIDVRQNELD